VLEAAGCDTTPVAWAAEHEEQASNALQQGAWAAEHEEQAEAAEKLDLDPAVGAADLTGVAEAAQGPAPDTAGLGVSSAPVQQEEPVVLSSHEE
jgi:hypothetical protein